MLLDVLEVTPAEFGDGVDREDLCVFEVVEVAVEGGEVCFYCAFFCTDLFLLAFDDLFFIPQVSEEFVEVGVCDLFWWGLHVFKK